MSFLRRHKSLLPLTTNDDGEPYQGRVLISLSEGMRDPQMEVEHEMAVHELLDNLVDAILELPVMQKLAMVCFLLDRMDNPALLIAAFKKRRLDIEHFRWPEDKDARQRLKASYYYARTKIAQHLDIDLATYKGLRKARYNYSSRSIQGSTLGERVTTEQTTSPPTEYEVREIAMNKETSGEVGNPTSITVEIATLAEPYRTAVYLHCVEGLSYSKIGIRLGLRVGTVKSHVSRGMCLLREASKSESDKDSREKQDNPEHETLNSAPSLAAQIEALPEPYRTTLRLHKLEGLSYPAIAAQLDIPVGTVKSHVSRGMRLLGSSVAEVVVMG